MSNPVLSILIPSIERHKPMLGDLLMSLKDGYAWNEFLFDGVHIMRRADNLIEILVDEHETDPTGRKRNRLTNLANGIYVSSIDADDWIYPWYVEEILKAAQLGCDCMAISGIMTTNGTNEIGWRLSKDNPNTTITENGQPLYLRTTNHIAPVLRTIALQAMFPDEVSNGEDKAYSEKLKPLLKTEATIDLPMYHYRYETCKKEYLK
jgi:hypothetical protein